VIDHVGSSWDEVQNAWNTHKPVLTGRDNAKLTMDEDALVAHLDQFEREVDNTGAPEAAKAAFKKEVRAYYELVQTRNNKLSETDALVVRQADLRVQIVERQRERRQLLSLKAANQDPAADRYLVLLDAMSDALLEQARILVWQEARALFLWSLQPPPDTRFDGIEFTDLAQAHGLIANEFRLRESWTSGSAETMDPVSVSFPLSAEARRGLATDGKVALNVERSDFWSSWYAIYVTHVGVAVAGVDRFRARLTHPGRGFFETARRGEPPRTFSMPPRSSTVTDHTRADLGAEDGKYVGMSPFTQWILAFETPEAAALATATSIDLVFHGKHRTRPA
jgi:hypothetical protein